MSEISKDEGVIVALVKRFEQQRLPWALDIKKRVDAGEVLSPTDIDFLRQVFADAKQMAPIAERRPEWQAIYAKGIHLYKEIMDQASANEKAQKD